MKFRFEIGAAYKREEVIRLVGVLPVPKGGAWYTGAVSHEGATFIFCNVGVPGRTGHDYENYFDGADLCWSGKTGSHRTHPSIAQITRPNAEVHVFFRAKSNSPFTYAGRGVAISVDDQTPVRIRWALLTDGDGAVDGVEMIPWRSRKTYREGAVKVVVVNAYEGSPQARQACIEFHGARCLACGFDFEATYGELGRGFVHVHHLVPLAARGEAYELDPVKHLIPVCPNCHSMLHRASPPLTVFELQRLLERPQLPASNDE